MAVKSGPKIDPKKYYPEPISLQGKKRMIMYHPVNRFSSRKGVGWDAHGFRFDEGIVYSVSELVYEWAKRQTGFFEVRNVETDKIVDFK